MVTYEIYSRQKSKVRLTFRADSVSIDENEKVVTLAGVPNSTVQMYVGETLRVKGGADLFVA
jgi:hypothetical protein